MRKFPQRSHTVPQSRYLWSVICGAAIGCHGGESPSRLRLDETSRVMLPQSFHLSGVAAGPAESLIVWSAGGSAVHWRGGKAVRLGASELEQPIAAGVAPSGNVEVVDGRRRLVYEFDELGRVVSRRTVRVAGTLLGATASPAGWMFQLADTAGLSVIVIETLHGMDTVLSLPAERGTVPTHIYLRSSASTALITRINPPFSGWKISLLSHAVEMLEAPPYEDAGLPGRPRWAGLPAVPVGGFSLQTISDLRSDTRVLLLRDSLGRIVRQDTLKSAIGMFASDPRKARVIGVQSLDSTAIIAYTWRWELQ